jgi:hypothetical protein
MIPIGYHEEKKQCTTITLHKNEMPAGSKLFVFEKPNRVLCSAVHSLDTP